MKNIAPEIRKEKYNFGYAQLYNFILHIKTSNDNYEKIDILLNLYKKLIEKTEKTFKLLFEYFDFYKYLGDKMNVITEEQKGEIKEKFDKMLDFLLNNNDNKKYDKDQFDNVVNNITEFSDSTLF